MGIAYEVCLVSAGKAVPTGSDWIHEIKHDGSRMLVGGRARSLTLS